MMRSCFRPLERCLGRFNGNGVDGLWHKELKPHALGDYSIAVVQANSNLEDQCEVLTTPSVTFVGVYDGHGGPEASRFIKEKLFPYINKFSREQGGLSSDAIKKAFDSTEEDFLHLVRTSFPARPKIASVGSCCLVGAITNDVLYVANLGDSRAVLGRRASEGMKSPVVAERLTTDHNVCVEEVRKEVRDLHPDDSHIVICNRGVWRIKGIIQVSRSIGDVYLKKPEFNRNPMFQQFAGPMHLKRAVVTAEPSIIKRKINTNDLFLVFASDGLWEQLSDETVVKIVFKSPRAGIARRLVRAAIREAARKKEMDFDELAKMEKGTRRYFHDDITVVVVYLDHHKGSRKMKRDRFVQREDNRISAPAEIFSSTREALHHNIS